MPQRHYSLAERRLSRKDDLGLELCCADIIEGRFVWATVWQLGSATAATVLSQAAATAGQDAVKSFPIMLQFLSELPVMSCGTDEPLGSPNPSQILTQKPWL